MLQLCARVGERQKTVAVETFSPQLDIERFDEGVVGRLAWPAGVERDHVLASPEIEIARDELGALIDTDRAGINNLRFRKRIIHNSVFLTMRARWAVRRHNLPSCCIRGCLALLWKKLPYHRFVYFRASIGLLLKLNERRV